MVSTKCFMVSTKCFRVNIAFSFSWVQGQCFTCGSDHWLWDNVSSPPPASLEALIFCWLLLVHFQSSLLFVGSGQWIGRIFSDAGVDECLDLLHCCKLGFSMICLVRYTVLYLFVLIHWLGSGTLQKYSKH